MSHNTITVNDGVCIDTMCAVASLDIDEAGLCPGGQVQVSYWGQPGCTGKWFGYSYTSKGTCHRLWTEGWKFKSLHLRCASKEEDCVRRGTCTYSPQPVTNVCL